MRRLLNRKGQSTLEYALLIVIVLAALLAVQIYLRRGVQGRVRSSIDSIGQQYDTGSMRVNRTIDVGQRTNEELFGLGGAQTFATRDFDIFDQGTSDSSTTSSQTVTEDETITRGLSAENLFE